MSPLNQRQELHKLLVKKLAIKTNIRKNLVRITGSKYQPLDNQFQIQEALEKFSDLVNYCEEPINKALLSLALLAYIQAFEDGNKRTSRLCANAVLVANSYCPLSFRSINEVEYKKSIILFYEQNNLSYLKNLLIEQFEFAVNNYW